MTEQIYYLDALIPFLKQHEIGHSEVAYKFKPQTCFDGLVARMLQAPQTVLLLWNTT